MHTRNFHLLLTQSDCIHRDVQKEKERMSYVYLKSNELMIEKAVLEAEFSRCLLSCNYKELLLATDPIRIKLLLKLGVDSLRVYIKKETNQRHNTKTSWLMMHSHQQYILRWSFTLHNLSRFSCFERVDMYNEH